MIGVGFGVGFKSLRHFSFGDVPRHHGSVGLQWRIKR